MSPTGSSLPRSPDPRQSKDQAEAMRQKLSADFYCPQCAREVGDPLTCGDCSAVICRVCGTPLEAVSDLGIE